MTRNEIINDIKFKQACNIYGLNWEDLDIYRLDNDDYVILLQSSNRNASVLFDKNYNTIYIDYFPDYLKDNETIKRFVEIRCRKYGENFSYPFESFSVKQIVDLANRIEIIETNHGHSFNTKVNGDWYEKNSKEHEDYVQLLSYIKFLGEEIKQYFLYKYQMQMMGFEVPDIYLYVRKLINKVNECIEYHIQNNTRPYPHDILNYIGQNHKILKCNGMLFDVIDLIMKEKGVKIKSGFPNELETIEDNEKKDLSKMATQLLKLIELSDEDLKNNGSTSDKNPILRYRK